MDRWNAPAGRHGADAMDRRQICAVVVTYFPQASCTANLAALAPQVGKVVIVDNGSDERCMACIEAEARRIDAVIIRLGANLGIAAALNVGLRFANQHRYTWLATFDQDSQATPSMVGEMLQALTEYPVPEKIAVVSPCPVDRRLQVDLRYPGTLGAAESWRLLHCAGTSGCLVNVQSAIDAGGFDDSLFIDYVDFEFCLRLRGRGFQVLEATRAVLLHELGSMQYHKLFFGRIAVSHHSPTRRYYMTRNRLILWRRYWLSEVEWVLRDVGWFVLEAVCLVLYESETSEKVRMLLKGIRDGVTNVRGAYGVRHPQ